MSVGDDVSLEGTSPPNLADNVRLFFIALVVVQVSVEILDACASRSLAEGCVAFALCFTLSAAAGLTGGLLGFIFGIPRALTDGEMAQANSEGRKSKPNTNLEQISDWLTKILVGATLTSIASLPGWGRQLVQFFDTGPFHSLPGGGTLAVCLIALFATLGFFWSYIETRTFLTLLFDTYGVSADLLLKVRSAPWEPGNPPIPEDAAALRWDGAKLNTAALLEARAAAETRAGHFTGAINFYQRALLLDPANPRIQARISVLLARTGKPSDADSLIEKLQKASDSNPAQQSLLEVNKVYSALYKAPPKGYEEAIEIGERLRASDQSQNGQLNVWLACAYAQRAKFKNKEFPATNKDNPDRRRTLDLLRDALHLRPDLLALVRSIWRPKQYGGAPGDNDLEIFSDDEEFLQLLA